MRKDEKKRENAGRRLAFEPVPPFVFVRLLTRPAVYLALMVLKPQVDNEKRGEK